MTESMIIEEESGSLYPRARRRHNGYYAGDFSNQPLCLLTFKDGTWHSHIVRNP